MEQSNIKIEKEIGLIKIAIGLVVRGGKQFIDGWIESANRMGDVIFVIDNEADEKVKNVLINHPKVKEYHIQKGKKRNMSRDYQKILDYAKEHKCHWVWIMDIDKYVPPIPKKLYHVLKDYMLNTKEDSIGFPLFEMRGDKNHYIMIPEKQTGELKHARLSHEAYKVQSHFAYDIRDEHSGVIPQNCKPSEGFVTIPIHHYGHMTPELREEKRQKYIKDALDYGYNDKGELESAWMSENDEELTIKKWEDFKWEN